MCSVTRECVFAWRLPPRRQVYARTNFARALLVGMYIFARVRAMRRDTELCNIQFLRFFFCLLISWSTGVLPLCSSAVRGGPCNSPSVIRLSRRKSGFPFWSYPFGSTANWNCRARRWDSPARRRKPEENFLCIIIIGSALRCWCTLCRLPSVVRYST